MYRKNGCKQTMSDGIGLSGDCVCMCVCLLLPKKSADAAPVAESLAGGGHAGRHRRAWWEIEQDCRKKHRDCSQLCRSPAQNR